MATRCMAVAPPQGSLGLAGAEDRAQQVRSKLSQSGLLERLDTLFLPMVIHEDSFRPTALEPAVDPLDFQQALAEQVDIDFIVTQVTPFTPIDELERRVERARWQGVGRKVFVGVPREFDPDDVVGLYPDQALKYFSHTMPSRGVIMIPTRVGESARFGHKVESGATFTITQLLYSEAVIDFLRALPPEVLRTTEFILSFGYIPRIERDNGLIQWLIQDDPPAAEAEMRWVADTARRPFAQRKRRLLEHYQRVIDGVTALGVTPGINLEAPYGLADGALETFGEMLEVYSP